MSIYEMKKTNLGNNGFVEYAEHMRRLYEQLLNGEIETQKYQKLEQYLLNTQKQKGEWSEVLDCDAPHDCVVAYVYEPTYHACAMLIFMDMHKEYAEASPEMKMLERGLDFAKNSHFAGHGYDAIDDTMRALRIFENAGIYNWFLKRPNKGVEFRQIWITTIETIKQSYERGAVFSGWNQDYSKEMEERVSKYEREYVNCGVSYVWYACYGSNINQERFYRYLDECVDSSRPTAVRKFMIPYKLYFAGSESRLWNNRATAYLDYTSAGQTLGKLYKITKQQFDTVKQREGQNYTELLELGELEGFPIFTFTNKNIRQDRNIPCLCYFHTILQGLTDLYEEYSELQLAVGLIETFLQETELKVLSYLRKAEHKVSLEEISAELGGEKRKIIHAVHNLLDKTLIKQDKRSLSYSYHDDKAEFFTVESERTFIDQLVAMWQEAQMELDAYRCQEDLDTTVVEVSEEENNGTEGSRQIVYTTRYERNPRNRMAAIRLHGTKCQACGFDFEKHYGEHGKGFIEVHHVKPLHTLGEEAVINPETDLVCLCSNCHRMIHHKRGQVLTLAELRNLIRTDEYI